MKKKTAHREGKKNTLLVCPDAKKRLCLACGQTPIPKRKRRYCSDRCKKRLDFALYICTGLVEALRARYAAFSYTEEALVLDVLPSAAKSISRFVWKRSKSQKVADDLLDLVQEAGRDWYELEEETGSSWWASQHLLDKTSREDIPVTTVMPVAKRTPQLNHKEKSALKLLKLTKQQILSKQGLQNIKSAYRKNAKRYHPDKGDKTNRFIQINEAHAELLNWTQNPKFSFRAALPKSWCYDREKKRWAPPI